MGIFSWLTGESELDRREREFNRIWVEGYLVDAERGDPLAQYNLAASYLSGERVAKDVNAGFKWLKKSGDQHFLAAEVALGNRYAMGKNDCAQNYQEAVRWYLKAANRDLSKLDKTEIASMSNAINNLGFIYAKGKGITEHNRLVFELLEMSVDRVNSVPSAYCLGYMFANGCPGIDIDIERSAVFFGRMIVNDVKNSEHKIDGLPCRIVQGYTDIEGNRLPFTEVIEFLSTASDKGIAKAQFAMGLAHYYGWRDVPQEERRTIKFLYLASTQGDIHAKEMLSHILVKIPETNKACSTRTEDTENVLADGNSTAMHSVTDSRSIIESIENGNTEALDQVLSLAAQGDPVAQMHLGYLCQFGIGMEQKLQDAELWYLQAAVQGNTNAKINLRSIDPIYRLHTNYD